MCGYNTHSKRGRNTRRREKKRKKRGGRKVANREELGGSFSKEKKIWASGLWALELHKRWC